MAWILKPIHLSSVNIWEAHNSVIIGLLSLTAGLLILKLVHSFCNTFPASEWRFLHNHDLSKVNPRLYLLVKALANITEKKIGYV